MYFSFIVKNGKLFNCEIVRLACLHQFSRENGTFKKHMADCGRPCVFMG